ncbi:MAG: T9SS type A sorting domain-containing protein [Saprospiraceae bacterium]|nr:T9SS type A sorting domain-containing protein [Saprospiraceae bacterium]
MKKITLLILSLITAMQLYSQPFDNGDFEQFTCLPVCANPISCTPSWWAYDGTPNAIYAGGGCDRLVCQGDFSMLIRRGDQTGVKQPATKNPVFQQPAGGNYAVNMDFYISENSETSGRLEIYGENGNGLVLLGSSDCIPAEDLCQNITVTLNPSVVDYENLVFGVDNCSGLLGSFLPVIEGVMDNISMCQPYEILISTPNCNDLCFTLKENNCSGIDSESLVMNQDQYFFFITTPNGDEVVLDSENPEGCMQIPPGTTVELLFEVFILYKNGDLGYYSYTEEYTQPDPQTTAEFIVVDSNGDEEDVFCYGEPIYFQNTNTNDETEWFIAICMQNIGDLPSDPCLGWTSNQVNGNWNQGQVPDSPINLLTDVWQLHHPDWDFWPNLQYTVQLAVRNKPCVSWEAYYVTFIVEECSVDVINYTITPIDECTYCFSPNFEVSDCIDYTNYYWDFGDGETSTELNPCHTFDSNDNFNVKFILEGYSMDPNGNPAPVACSWDEFGSIICPHECEPACKCDVSNVAIGGLYSSGCQGYAWPETAVGNECTKVLSYSWDWGDNTPGTATSSPAGVWHNYNSSGLYLVCLTVTALNLETGAICSEKVCSGLAIHCAAESFGQPGSARSDQNLDWLQHTDLFYPNPADTELFFISELTDGQINPIAIIYDATGKTLIQQPLTSHIPIDISSLNAGVYFVKIRTDNGLNTVKKLVVK